MRQCPPRRSQRSSSKYFRIKTEATWTFKLSSSSHKSKSKSSSVRCHSTSSESDSDSDTSLPKLSALRSSVSLQRQVDAHLRDLESSQDETGMPNVGKIKSKRGGPVDVLVKHKIAWSYDFILVG